MINSKFTAFSLAAISALFFMLSFTQTSNAQILYSCDSPSNQEDPLLRTVDPDTAATITETPLTLPGVELRGCNGLARDPITGVCWIMLSGPGGGGDSSPGPRILARLNHETGQATEVGDTGLPFAAIAFDSGRTLYGLRGDQGESAAPLFILNKSNGVPTLFLELVSADDGEALGFNPLDGLLYRMDGRPPVNIDQVFQSINPDTKEVTQIALSGPNVIEETTALTHLSGNTLLAAERGIGGAINNLYRLTTDGTVTVVGEMDHISKGLAFNCGIPDDIVRPIPTLSEWGLIVMAGVIGIAGFMVLRRRAATT